MQHMHPIRNIMALITSKYEMGEGVRRIDSGEHLPRFKQLAPGENIGATLGLGVRAALTVGPVSTGFVGFHKFRCRPPRHIDIRKRTS